MKNKKERQADRYLRRLYGIGIEDKKAMIKDQAGKCPICQRKLSKLRTAIDHNHETGEVRGVLCHNCNRMLGEAKENIETLKRAINYLKFQ